jgi:TorA maturation chaperone TorD
MTDDRAQAAAERGSVYELLATVFRQPLSGDQLRRLRSKPLAQALANAGLDLGHGFLEAQEAMVLEELAIDYTQLFHGPRDQITPYESVQTGREGASLNGRAAEQVRDFMALAGFELNAEAHELHDHIGVELAFVAGLAGEEAQAWRAGDASAARQRLATQRSFMDAHLGRWAPRFAHAVQAKAETDLYREMGRLLAAFIESERTMLALEGAAEADSDVDGPSVAEATKAPCGA